MEIASIDPKLDRLEQNIDKIMNHTASIDTTLALNTAQLSEHMKRTVLLEKALFTIKRIWDFCVVAVQLIGVCGVLAAIIEGAVSLLTYLHK
jgi:hypothetical protein